uniref:Uncharacterized protein n=1 Tax=viral metagenome TaxID=1070528 RepID=A0A6C0CTZ8_9ZZZZ
MQIYTPIKYKQEQLTRWILSWIPTYIHQVFYIPERSSYITKIFNYRLKQQLLSNHPDNEFKSGYYLFVYWNNHTYQMERIFMHTDHMFKALDIQDLQDVWGFSHHDLIDLLNRYLKKHATKSIIDIFIKDDNCFSILHKYLPSFQLPKNATARLVHIIYQCETEQPHDLKQEDFKVTFYTDTLDEFTINQDDYLYS